MRRISFLLGLLLVPARAAAEPQQSAGVPRAAPASAVQLDLGLAVVGLAYERLFEPRLAVQFEAHVFGTWFGPLFDLPNVRGLGGQIRPTFFLTDDGPRGFYVAPFVRIERVTAEEGPASGSAVGYSTGAFAGYSFVLGDRFNVRVGAGAQRMSYVVDVGGTTKAFDTFFPALDLVLGYLY